MLHPWPWLRFHCSSVLIIDRLCGFAFKRTFVFTPECKYKMLTEKREKPCVLTSETQMMLFANAIKNLNFRFRLNV